MNPFDFLNDINKTQKGIMTDENEKEYNSFVINRSLSYFNDTVLFANEMNVNHHLDNILQYHFLLNIVRPRKRFSKWIKPTLENDLEAVKEFYGYSNEKAHQILSLLSDDQINYIKKKINKGGKRGK